MPAKLTPHQARQPERLAGFLAGRPAGRVAGELGVSASTVRRVMASGRFSPALEKGLRRWERSQAAKPRWISAEPAWRNIAAQLEVVGVHRRDGTLNRAATARLLGTSPSQVGLWLRGDRRPSAGRQRMLADLVQRSPDGPALLAETHEAMTAGRPTPRQRSTQTEQLDRASRGRSTAETAELLGASESTVRRAHRGEFAPSLQAGLAQWERSQAAQPEWVHAGSHSGMVSAGLFPGLDTAAIPDPRDVPSLVGFVGVRRRDGSLDRAATGRAFGVSASTIGSWLRGKTRPSQGHQSELVNEARARALTDSDGAAQAASEGMQFRVDVTVKVSSEVSRRVISQRLDAQDTRDLQQQWVLGGDEAAAGWLRSHIENDYFGGGVAAQVQGMHQVRFGEFGAGHTTASSQRGTFPI